jgi:hypothetical protein
MIGPLPPSFTICVTNSKFALKPAAAAMRPANPHIFSIRTNFFVESRWATTWRMVSTKPSSPTSTFISLSRDATDLSSSETVRARVVVMTRAPYSGVGRG